MSDRSSTVPEWRTNREAIGLIARGVTLRTGTRVALVVGTLLTAVNQGGVLLAGDATAVTWARVGFNYAVPFIVSSVGYLAPFRTGRGTRRSPRR